MRIRFAVALALAALVSGAAVPARAQAFVLETKDGGANIKIGFLVQGQAEWLEVLDPKDTSQKNTASNLFLRRMRLMLGGKLNDHWTFFVDTDSPNIGRTNPDIVANPSGAREAGNIYVQDAFVTYSHGDAFKVDTGMLLTALSHNHIQGAISLLPVDYGAYTFTENAGLQQRVGRDYGVSLRGYPFKKKMEYRLGVFGGLRGTEARNPLRFVGRLAWWPFDADMGYFYSGTYQAQKRVMTLGASFDVQDNRSGSPGSYKSFGADFFLEQPFKDKTQGLTLQADYMHFDGDKFVPSIVKQDDLLLEAGYHLAKARFTPFVQYVRRDLEPATGNAPLQQNWNVGLAYWIKGHNRNVKASVGQQKVENQKDRLQALVQLQVMAW